MAGNEICVQYIFSSFNEKQADSCRYLIACYFDNQEDEALRKFTLWYTQDKFDYERVVKENEIRIHTEQVEKEMERYRKWRERTSLTETPTVLVNGHKLSGGYELEDLAMIANVTIIGKNILQDINGKHVPLAAN